MLVQPASQLTPRSVDWLWLYRLARGKLTLYDGDPALGKSFVALDLCARLSSGRPFPDGLPSNGPAACLILSAEDPRDDTLLPRLYALGANMEHIFFWPDDQEGLLQLPSQLDLLDELLAKTKAQLMVLDPLMAFLEARALASEQSIRAVLQALSNLAVKHRCAGVMSRHLNKRPGGPSLYRGTGQIAFAAYCRITWLAGADPKVAGRFVLAQHKCNLAPPQPSLGYQFTSPQVARPVPAALPKTRLLQETGFLSQVAGPVPAVPTIDWLGPCAWTARNLVSRGKARPCSTRALSFLNDLLKDGPRTSKEIWAAARRHRLSQRTVERAQQELGIRCHRVNPFRKDQRTYWLLPHQQLPADAQTPDNAALDAWFKDMEEKFPPRDPLDENAA